MVKIKNISVVPDILSQSQDNLFIKTQFLVAFFFHYLGKKIGLKLNFFPKMKIKLENCLFFTREKTIDFWMFWKNYEKEINRDLKEIKSKGTFVDVGANIGRYSILMAKKGLDVYAFEPLKDNFDLLKNHVKINEVQKKVDLNHLGISSKKEVKEIFFESHKHGEASIVLKNEASESEKINVERLDYLLLDKKLKNPVVLKIDVEGFEYEVLLGAKNFIKKYKPLIIIEIWQKKKDTEFLKKLNYNKKGEIWHYKK